MEAWILAVYAEIEALKAEIEGMKALNQYRIDVGKTITYDDKAFQEKADLLWSIVDSLSR